MKRIIVILFAICFIGSSSFAENKIAFLTDYYADCLDLSSMKGLYLGRRVSETERSDHNSRDQYVCSYPSAYFISGYVDKKPLLVFYNEYAQKVDLYLWNEGEMRETDLSFSGIEAELILAYVDNWLYYFNRAGIYRANTLNVELLYSADSGGISLYAGNEFFKPVASENGEIAFIDGDLIICIEPTGRITKIALECDAHNWGTEKSYDVMPTVVWLDNREILFFNMVSDGMDDMRLEVMKADVQNGQISRCLNVSGDQIVIKNRYVGERGVALENDRIALIMSDFAYPSPDYVYSYAWSCDRVGILSLRDGSLEEIFVNNRREEVFGLAEVISVDEEIVYNSCIVKIEE